MGGDKKMLLMTLNSPWRVPQIKNQKREKVLGDVDKPEGQAHDLG
jgi:hypothetical protein